MEEAEIVFAQKLASGEPVTRKRALKTLRDWIRDESTKNEFDVESMNRLCKGLHYVMWMQDKMLLQEELADHIASFITLFTTEQQSILFVKSMLITLSNEWSRVDRWRMDKFLMLMRRLLRALFIHLRKKKWRESIVDAYMNAFKECVISTDKSFCEGLKFHFASIFLDELDNAGGLRAERVTKLLEPFAQLLAEKQISNYLFDSVLQEIFLTILHGYADEKAGALQAKNEPMEENADDDRLKFNYGEIGQMLFDIGKNPQMKSGRRKRLYNVSKKFKAAEAGEDPFRMVTKAETKLKTKIPKAEIVKAVSRLLNEQAKDAKLRKKAKLKKRHAKKLQEASTSVQKVDTVKEESAQKMKKVLRKDGKIHKKRKNGVTRKEHKGIKRERLRKAK